MTREAIENARNEALKFVKRADNILFEMDDPTKHRYSPYLSPRSDVYPKQSGAVRRQSMELTRALADLRRS